MYQQNHNPVVLRYFVNTLKNSRYCIATFCNRPSRHSVGQSRRLSRRKPSHSLLKEKMFLPELEPDRGRLPPIVFLSYRKYFYQSGYEYKFLTIENKIFFIKMYMYSLHLHIITWVLFAVRKVFYSLYHNS